MVRDVCRDARAAYDAAYLASVDARDDEALQEATRKAAKALGNAQVEFHNAAGPYQELRRRLVAEAAEKFPITPPQGLRLRAELARHAANHAAYELRQLGDASTVKTCVAAEAEQMAQEAEAKVTPEALAAEAAEINMGPQEPLHTPNMFEAVTA